MSNSSSWYVVTIIIKCEINGLSLVSGEWSCIQSIHLIKASSNSDAFEKATLLGKEKETSYMNSGGELVEWKFVGLENLENLTRKTISDGLEIWGRYFQSNNPSALVVNKERLSIYFDEEICDVPANKIIEDGIDSKLVINRIRK